MSPPNPIRPPTEPPAPTTAAPINARTFYAHTLPGARPENWERLEEHLENVARLAQGFANAWDAGDWGYIIGLWHDLGKFSAEFQAYLYRANGFEAHLEEFTGRVDHSTAGAQHAVNALANVGRILAYCIAGHHAGLPDTAAVAGQSGLDQRLKKVIPQIAAAPPEILAPPALSPPRLTLDHGDAKRGAFQLALFCRMLFSCLVDADFLATESFLSPDKTATRSRAFATLAELQEALDDHLAQLAAGVERNHVYECRQEILAACRAAATSAPGLFSLTVPTGGGKTLASLAFAILHAQQHGFERIIFAIPFTSIIEQTAQVFRAVFKTFGDDVVLEHHCNLDPEQETPYSRLAKENWDAPVVVTTNVQFFESLFAAGTSRCRKLHRIARSVVILDEAQTLPVELLRPCLAVLRELAADYHCSIILCTATQPAITRRNNFPIGLESVREIIPEPRQLYARMNRVRVQHLGKLGDDELLQHLRRHDRFLCIVNTRGHAARLFCGLYETLSSREQNGTFHLSTLMCGQHRSKVIRTIRKQLTDGKPCRVISTQLVEAGVDLDFPVVFRALAGVDSIAQAAGRCNREGKQASGDVYVFEPRDIRLRGFLAATANSTAELMPDFDDLLSLDAVERYFQLHYWKHADRCDSKAIMDLFQSPQKMLFQFRTAERQFRMIDDASQPVIVPWGKDGKRLIREIRQDEPPDWRIKRKLQRYVVPVYEQFYRQMLGSDVAVYHDCYAVLTNEAMYDEKLGLCLDRAGYREPESLIV